jgi:hypothetical protein
VDAGGVEEAELVGEDGPHDEDGGVDAGLEEGFRLHGRVNAEEVHLAFQQAGHLEQAVLVNSISSNALDPFDGIPQMGYGLLDIMYLLRIIRPAAIGSTLWH